jgi:hypothetical protein
MDIQDYLQPLTNNERAVLLFAAGVKYDISRTSSVWNDISIYSRERGKSVPKGQLDKAINGLIDKGYATIQPKRGNMMVTRGQHIWPSRTTDGHGMWYGYRAAPYHKIFAEKMAGQWNEVDLWKIVDVIPVKHVKDAVAEFRSNEKNQQANDRIAAGEQTVAKTQEMVDQMEAAAKKFLAALANGDEMMPQDDGWYDLHDSIKEMESATKSMAKWRWDRKHVEAQAQQAAQEVAA